MIEGTKYTHRIDEMQKFFGFGIKKAIDNFLAKEDVYKKRNMKVLFEKRKKLSNP